MAFGPKQADITAIKDKTDNLPADPASESEVEAAVAVVQAKTDNLPSDPTSETGGIARKYPFLDFPSALEDLITVSSLAGDIDFPNIVVSSLPSGLTIVMTRLVFICRTIEDTSGAANYINGSGKTLRVKKSTGAWATDSIVGVTFADQSLYCAANSKENGLPVIGSADIKSVGDGNATYNIRSEETNHGEGLVSLGDDLELRDIQLILRVFYS